VLTDVPPLAPAYLIIGLGTWYVPFYGGTLVPSFDYYLPLRTQASGTLIVSGEWPADLPQGMPIYLQYWISDTPGSSRQTRCKRRPSES
jgi:hypothetical protein